MNPPPRITPSSFDSPSLPFAIIGFVMPVVGLLLYFINKSATPRKANSALKGAGVGLGMGIIGFLFIALLATSAQPPAARAGAPGGSPSAQVSVPAAEADEIVVAKKAMGALIGGDAAAESLIDWTQLQYMRKNIGESYQTLTSEPAKAAARKKFIGESSASFRKKGIKAESLTNWQVQSQEPGGTLVTCSLPDGNSLSVTIAGDKLTSIQG